MNKISILIVLGISLFSCGPSEEELFSQSRAQMQAGNFEGALSMLDDLIHKNSDNLAAYNMGGIAKLELGQAENAISDFDFSVMLDSSDYRAFYNRGNAYYQLKNFKQAIIDYDLALKLEPKSTDLYINRANALAQLEKYAESINDYRFALKLDASSYLTHFNLARTYYLMDSTNLAKTHFQKTVDIYPGYAPAFYFLGMISLENEAFEESCILLQKAADLGYQQAIEVQELYCVED